MDNSEFLDLINNFRGVPFNQEEIVQIIYIFEAWKILSDGEEIINNSLLFNKEENENIIEIFNKLASYYEIFKLFTNTIDISKLEEKYIILILDTITQNIKLPKITHAMSLINGQKHIFITSQIVDLSVRLLNKNLTEIYAPFTQGYNIASYTNATIYSESSYRDDNFIVEVIKILEHKNIKFKCTNILENPTYKENHTLKQFEYAISFPPFRVINKSMQFHYDKYNRFNIYRGEASLDVAHFEQILAQTTEKAIILTSVGFTFRGGVDEKFRKYLIDNNYLEAIIHLPPNLHSNTSIETIFFVVNKKKINNNVYFLDLRDNTFTKKDGRKVILKDLDNITSLYKECIEIENISTLTTTENIIENDYFFTVDRYIISQEIEQLTNIFSSSNLIKLETIAELRKSQLFKNEEQGFNLYVVSPSDFVKAGYTLESGKIKLINTQESKYETYKLLPNDILLSVKGSIGKVAIVGLVSQPMIASQAIQVIRIKDENIISPIYLYMFFKSDIGKLLLKQLVSGSTMPQISTKSIKELKIPILPRPEYQHIIEKFHNEIKMVEKIYELENSINELHKDFFRGKK